VQSPGLSPNATKAKENERFNTMKTQLIIVLSSLTLLSTRTFGATVLFDFDSAPVHTPFPLTLTVGGITAQFSATGGQGFSIQPANTMGFTPAGFAGNCIYPDSIYASDLLVSFSQPLTAFSILYAPDELACDSSARMRVTAYLDGVEVGTTTTNAQAGTWPSETLAIYPATNFNSVVVHYDAPPPTGGDYGVIFMADNMLVTTLPPPIVLTDMVKLPNGTFQFSFTNEPAMLYSVWTTSDLTKPFSQWTLAGTPTEISPGQYQFTDTQSATSAHKFYRVSSP
jgi:hypothetical protein